VDKNGRRKSSDNIPQRWNPVGRSWELAMVSVGTSWELSQQDRQKLPRGMTIKKRRKNNDDHGASPRTMKNHPHEPNLIPSPKTQGKLVKWHGGSG
jgi:hypothetical protein